jgi:hypothetical protein
MNRLAGRIAPLVAGMVVVWPTVAHADPAGATDWRSEIVSVSPASDAMTVSIEGGDAFVRVAVDEGHEVVVEGYDGEPYLRIDATGDVFENRNSYATYYNTSRDGSGEIPPGIDATAEPDWKQIGDGGAWAWHDHRAHLMGNVPPPGVDAGDSLTPQVISLIVDGVETEVTVRTTLVDRPSWSIAAAGAAVGVAAGGGLLMLSAGRRAALVAAVAGAALIAGGVQFTSLPAETAPPITWWLMPAVALVSAVGMLGLGNRLALVRVGMAAVAASQLVLWAWMRRQGVRRGVLPTDLPFALDRLITVTVLVAGAVMAVIVAVDVVALVRQPPRASSMASSSSS